MACRQSGFKLKLSLLFFLFVSLFLFFFNLLVCFPFIPTAGALSELHEVCDKRIFRVIRYDKV